MTIAASAIPSFRYQAAVSTIAIASTRWRPYRLGSRNSEVVRKKLEYAFPIWTEGV